MDHGFNINHFCCNKIRPFYLFSHGISKSNMLLTSCRHNGYDGQSYLIPEPQVMVCNPTSPWIHHLVPHLLILNANNLYQAASGSVTSSFLPPNHCKLLKYVDRVSRIQQKAKAECCHPSPVCLIWSGSCHVLLLQLAVPFKSHLQWGQYHENVLTINKIS